MFAGVSQQSPGAGGLAHLVGELEVEALAEERVLDHLEAVRRGLALHQRPAQELRDERPYLVMAQDAGHTSCVCLRVC